MIYVLATLAAFAIIALAIGIVVLYVILVRLRDLDAMEIWMRSCVEELGCVTTSLRRANAAQSRVADMGPQ